MKNRVFTTGEVATICGVSADTVSRWFDSGQLEGYRLGSGGDRRIPYLNLKKFMIARGIPVERIDHDEIRILVVDDDPYYLDIIPAVLTQDSPYTVFTASTGFEAGIMVVEHNPQAVILDIHLSDIDGRVVCERIRTRQETAAARILGISGFIDEEEIGGLSVHGFDDFLKKPFQIEELKSRIKQLLHMPVSRMTNPGQDSRTNPLRQ